VAAPKRIPNTAPITSAFAVNSGIEVSSGTYGLKLPAPAFGVVSLIVMGSLSAAPGAPPGAGARPRRK
jgi:hypothetical protein